MSTVNYKSAATVPVGGPSPRIWADCPVITMQNDPGKGIHFMEDFLAKYTDLAAAGVLVGTMFEFVLDGAGGACTEDATAYDNEHGVVVITPTGSSAYDEAYLISQMLYQLKMNSERKMWFEARIKLSDITDDMSLICGLGDATLLAGTSVIQEHATPTTIESQDFVGFVAFTDGTKIHDIDAIYHEVNDTAVTQVKDAAFAQASWVNDTYVKMGLKFDGKKSLTYYINGALVGTLDVDDFATVTANELTPLGIIVGKMDGDASASNLSIDWIRFACDRNDAQ